MVGLYLALDKYSSVNTLMCRTPVNYCKICVCFVTRSCHIYSLERRATLSVVCTQVQEVFILLSGTDQVTKPATAVHCFSAHALLRPV